jgi:hypothetical protein
MFVGFFRSRTEVQGLNGPCREKEKERPFNRALGDESLTVGESGGEWEWRGKKGGKKESKWQ